MLATYKTTGMQCEANLLLAIQISERPYSTSLREQGVQKADV